MLKKQFALKSIILAAHSSKISNSRGACLNCLLLDCSLAAFSLQLVVGCFLMISFAFAPRLLGAQGISVGASATKSSDPQAIAIIEQSIAKLGGKTLWMQVGGATEQATISRSGLSPYTIRWSDDWSTGRVRFRRDRPAKNGNGTFSLVSSNSSQASVPPNGKAIQTPHDNGIVALAVGYPGAALNLSLSGQFACTFNQGQLARPKFAFGTPNPQSVLITEFCPDPSYPGGEAPLVWEFSKSDGTPVAVILPIWGLLSHSVRAQTITFMAFQSLDGLRAK